MSSKKASALKGKVDTPSTFPKKGNSYNTVPTDYSMAVQSTAVYDKFADILSTVWQKIYYESMNNIWDGILYDPVMDYCGAWLKRNHQLSLSSTIIPVASDNGNMQGTDGMSPKVYPLRLSVFLSLKEGFGI